ncbi:hypothetical protein RHGRI_009391 [Rhododendron griersonianum]|uniref:WW domain-containing protein n=1 Tax=Rhododendron griersonianum TaxID=479676 RepID=A0AAV6KF93_9ERIC|nr:hypothetical protein RHGRI_009391 [Rhododendron griersonianum]
MGKRKERRLAAKVGAGRRVKLDLFAEPSGESGGSSAQDELGMDMDPSHLARSPDSPSSSGGFRKQPENPLLLLGQYSDDELDEESSKRLDHATEENSIVDNNEQVKEPTSAETEDVENSPITELDAEKDKPHDLETCAISLDALQIPEDLESREIDSAVAADIYKEVVSTEETSVPGTAEQLTGNLSSSWKVVLHEESGQYYYWNTVTGETSWGVPDVLAQGTELTGEQKTAPNTEGVELDCSIDIGQAGSVIHETQQTYETGAQLEEQNNPNEVEGLEEKRLGNDANQSDLGDVLLSNGAGTCADSEKFPCNPMIDEEYDTENDLGSSVLKDGENLLDRLRSLERTHVQGHDWISKYVLEVEIRLSDIKSLMPFGSSLLPFWVHCERQLKVLESAIDNQVSHIFNYRQTLEAELPHKSRGSEGDEIEADGKERKVVCSASAEVDVSSSVLKDSKHEASNGNVFCADAIDYPASHSDSGSEGTSGVHEATQLSELTPQTAEDVDMDVDMEVEDEVPASGLIASDSLVAVCCAPVEQPIQESFVPAEAFTIPPPPDDDWIPPPPPDNELVPPPPPDDPSEPSYPPPQPTYFETVQPLSYTEQYSFSYPGSNFQYYGQSSTEYPTPNVPVSHPPLYFEALPSTYPGAAPAVVNPVEPVVYYDLQDGVVLPAPVASGAQSAVSYSESGHEAFGSGQIRSVDSHAEAFSTLLSNTEVGVSAANGTAGKALVDVPLTVATIQAPVTVSVVDTASASSTANALSKSTATNAQSKVLRSKKRTVAAVSTLKSNKKVSSLVDKWKAAKEELHEDEEDEPENTYEMLEKKRQREIEEWRAQQIASGEAKVNANFQPLGGDWRERVKRKRAQLKREAVQNSSGSPTDGNQQPNLNEVSRDLPSGWQAYWDESSKQFYYGNTVTSETTWTRPTK